MSLIEDTLLTHPEFRVQRKLVVDFSKDAIADERTSDVLIADLSDNWEEELALLGSMRRASERAPLIVVSSEDSAEIIKAAMKAGARDFFTHPLPGDDLVAAIAAISGESKVRDVVPSSVTLVMNAKGGAGASTLAANIACLMSSTRRRDKTVLLDLDFAGAHQPLYFDLKGASDVREALSYVHSLDETALQGYTLEHSSGVHLLAATQDLAMYENTVSDTALAEFVSLLSMCYQQVVIDLPRPAEPNVLPLLQNADKLMIVMQQTLTDVQGAKRLLGYLDSAGVPRSRIRVVINRFENRHPVTHDDIESTLGDVEILSVPNDYKHVSTALNAGEPLVERTRNAPVTTAIRALTDNILGVRKKARRRFFGILPPKSADTEQNAGGKAA
ncbi:AAA family ATPase [Granulosicoccaceae sp. 1_MG-2023]|nr:AAA family ATPase [Granulosicoccaceae sp. 1_MG-2023]